jgi:hypothetical protein
MISAAAATADLAVAVELAIEAERGAIEVARAAME